jgi:formate hydrogenlyase subunit 3/multisubunit Na+/H+ antiporter MnhD subunit|tara:strand:- start:561 stop:776 length:216 start_codon:yes stop_codon:yes gene_type:complete
MINLFGFSALGLALFALSNKNIIKLRTWHLVSSLMYIAYGFFINAMPVIVGAILYCLIHGFHIYKSKKNND